MVVEGAREVDSAAKARLAALLSADLGLNGATSPVSVAAQRLAQSLASSFETGSLALALFDTPDPLQWNAMARHIPDGDVR